MLTEVGDHNPRPGKCSKYFLIEAFVTGGTVEALHEAALPRAVWIDAAGLDLLGGQPSLDFLGDARAANV